MEVTDLLLLRLDWGTLAGDTCRSDVETTSNACDEFFEFLRERVRAGVLFLDTGRFRFGTGVDGNERAVRDG